MIVIFVCSVCVVSVQNLFKKHSFHHLNCCFFCLLGNGILQSALTCILYNFLYTFPPPLYADSKGSFSLAQDDLKSRQLKSKGGMKLSPCKALLLGFIGSSAAGLPSLEPLYTSAALEVAEHVSLRDVFIRGPFRKLYGK